MGLWWDVMGWPVCTEPLPLAVVAQLGEAVAGEPPPERTPAALLAKPPTTATCAKPQRNRRLRMQAAVW